MTNDMACTERFISPPLGFSGSGRLAAGGVLPTFSMIVCTKGVDASMALFGSGCEWRVSCVGSAQL